MTTRCSWLEGNGHPLIGTVAELLGAPVTIMPVGDQNEPGSEMGALLISDADRDQISAVLGEHMAEGRLTVEELDQRIGQLYASRTREQAAAVMVGLPPLDPPATEHHLHLGHEHDEDPFPSLPAWLAASALDEARTRPAVPTPALAAAAPLSHTQERAAARKRAKRHADENAIGHSFQARRRAITAQLEAAVAADNDGEAQRLRGRLREAEDAAAAARRALAAGDRAEVQRWLQRLRQCA